jgi:hypothetical protein
MMEGMQLGGGRPPFGITIRSRRSTNSSNNSAKKTFFNEFVNLQRTDEDGNPMPNPADPSSSRPRLIYCRDLHLLSESLPHWYPYFIDAVRARRQGPMSRPMSPVQNPTVVILGVSPSIITPRNASSSSSGPSGLVNFVLNRNRPPSRAPTAAPASPKVIEWDESPAAQRARDKRLHERLSDWEKHDASVFNSELPNLHSASIDAGGMRAGASRGLMSLFVAIPESGGGPPSIMPAPMEDDSSKERGTDHSRYVHFYYLYRSVLLTPDKAHCHTSAPARAGPRSHNQSRETASSKPNQHAHCCWSNRG